MPIPEIPSELFTYANNTFISEFSTVEGNIGRRIPVGANIWIKSARTGEVVEFAFFTADYDEEGDLTACHYKTAKLGLQATIFND